MLLYMKITQKFDNGYVQIEGKVTVEFLYFSTLVQARKLILSMSDHLILIHNIYEFHHA